MRIERIGHSSLRFDLGVFGKHDGGLYAAGEIVRVHTHLTTHETTPAPQAKILD